MTVTGRQMIAPAIMALMVGCGIEQDLGPRSDTYATDDDSAPVTAEGVPVRVNRVGDGDSIELDVGGAVVELRLEGYNAPELYIDADDGGRDVQTCNGLAAREAVKEMVAAADSIELVATGQDRFERTLGDLIVDGRSVTDRLIRDGQGLATGDDLDRRQNMVDATAAKLGIWGDRCGQPALDGLTIGEVQVNAPGDDRRNLMEEYVELVNGTSGPVELDGWVLRDDTTGHQFTLTGQLAPGGRVTVFTGGRRSNSDVSGDGSFYLEEPFPVWSNEWETVILVDPAGVFADWRFVVDGDVLVE